MSRTTIATTTTMAPMAYLAIVPPATWRRSTGSASGLSIVRTPPGTAGAASATATGSTVSSGAAGSGAVPPAVPWTLQVARFVAPAVLAFTALSALAELLREQFARLRVRWFAGDHVLVCGLGRMGARLAEAFHEAGYEVVAIEGDEHSSAIPELREEGVAVLVGDATDRTLLRTAGEEKARHLFAVTGDDDLHSVFRALADPSRRLLLDLLYERDGRTLTELESELVATTAMTRFGVMKHLKVLEEARLVTTRRRGREKLHYLNAVPIRLIYERWVSKYAEAWVSGLTGLKAELEEER